MRTHPISEKDWKRIKDAAYEWAWRKGWKVSSERFRKAEDLWEVEITLVSKDGRRENFV